MKQRRVMIIGLDAATLELVGPWAAEGRLPNIARFLQDGATGPLRSTLPAASPPAWSTFITGCNPGKHGILNFYNFVPQSYEPRYVNASHRHGIPFWEVAGAQGVKGGVINVPVTYPPEAFNGFLVAGMLTPRVDRKMVSPPEVFEDVMAASPHYSIDVRAATGRKLDPAEYLSQALDNAQARLECALHLYKKHRPPLFCVVFVAADRVCHQFWPYHEAYLAGKAKTPAEQQFGRAILEVYEKLDAAVGALLAEADEDTDILLMSDHGAGPLRKGLSLRKVLSDAGLLAEERPSALRGVSERAVWAAVRLVPGWLKRKACACFPRVAGRAAAVVSASGIDFARTKAYPTGQTSCIWVNVKGRQPKGVVEPGEQYEEVREKIIQLLSELKDPDTGQRVIRKVYRREEVWSGPCLEELPDLVVEQKDETYDTPTFAEVHKETAFYALPEPDPKLFRRLGGHKRQGIIMALGPHIKRCEIAEADIADVPATVLALLGCEIPGEFDGRVLTEILTDDIEERRGHAAGPTEPDRESSDFDGEDKAVIEERLRRLGYL